MPVPALSTDLYSLTRVRGLKLSTLLLLSVFLFVASLLICCRDLHAKPNTEEEYGPDFQSVYIPWNDAPDIINNSLLLERISVIHLFKPLNPDGGDFDMHPFEMKLTAAGLKLVDLKTAIKQQLPIISLNLLYARNEKRLSVLSISDVVTFSRQPLRKYRLDWYSRHMTANTFEEGCNKLMSKLIEDLRKARAGQK